MIKSEQIPRIAAIAATRHGLDSDTVREIVATALNAWEGATTEPRNWRTALVLPLPKEGE